MQFQDVNKQLFFRIRPNNAMSSWFLATATLKTVSVIWFDLIWFDFISKQLNEVGPSVGTGQRALVLVVGTGWEFIVPRPEQQSDSQIMSKTAVPL